MRSFVVAILVSIASAGRLENTYLPPTTVRFAGGSGNAIAAPFLGAGTASSFNQRTPTTATSFGSSSNIGAYVPPTAAIRSYSGPPTPPVPILRLNNDNNGDGSYQYDYETANHITVQESGHLKSGDINEVQGSFSYQAPDGQTISVSYVADENGYRAVGDHIPTPPPVPAEILKSLEINSAGQNGNTGNGQYSSSLGAAQSVSNQYLPPQSRQGGYS